MGQCSALRKKKDPAQLPAMMIGDERTGGYVVAPPAIQRAADVPGESGGVDLPDAPSPAASPAASG
jgi:hypothetical protein